MKLSYEQVKHIARLARLGLSEAEVEQFSLQLSDILENFEILNEVYTDDVPPATMNKHRGQDSPGMVGECISLYSQK